MRSLSALKAIGTLALFGFLLLAVAQAPAVGGAVGGQDALKLGFLVDLTWGKQFTMKLLFEENAFSLHWHPEKTRFFSDSEKELPARAFLAAYRNRTVAVEMDPFGLALKVYPVHY